MFVNPRPEYTIKTKMTTHLNLMDQVELNWRGATSWSPGSYWGTAFWTPTTTAGTGPAIRAFWTGRRGGVFIESVTCTIIRMEHDLDNFTSTFKLRAINATS